MSGYALRSDGEHWRTVGNIDELLEGETFSEVLPAYSGIPADDPAATERAWRDDELSSVVWLRDRHRDQLDIGSETTLSGDQFQELLVYMQALRDWPQSPDFPDQAERPPALDWLKTQ
ncbi:phage tail assembly chaperone [Pseudomonas quasicaspiana]|uniref:phage tail assembly chaperone n=1 Tax=Pseudomonas quasicaspiana TaxID=2829821 RepID=UPI001E38E1CD|nr:phage tail assembly chaperone [Pseudomonas quasicaspiana]MCD5977210.1 hypothetical protein [Pseudomonas quasicaspiana]